MASAAKQFSKSLVPTTPSTPPVEPFSNLYFLILRNIINLGNFVGVTRMSWDTPNLATKITPSPCLYWKCVCAGGFYFLSRQSRPLLYRQLFSDQIMSYRRIPQLHHVRHLINERDDIASAQIFALRQDDSRLSKEILRYAFNK